MAIDDKYKKKITLSVVIPTIDSSKFIVKNVTSLERFLKSQEKIKKYEIIISAQTSKDNTFELIKNLESNTIKPLFIRKRGKGIGLNAGFKNSKYDYILMVDDDFPYPFESMKKLIDRAQDHDIVIASRYVKKIRQNVPFVRRLASDIYIRIVKMILNIPQKDIQAGMKLIRKSIFERIKHPKEKGYVWDTELLYLANKHNMRITEVPVECIHKPNKLVIYKVAPLMLIGCWRVWWRDESKRIKNFTIAEYSLMTFNYLLLFLFVDIVGYKFWWVAIILAPLNYILKLSFFRKIFEDNSLDK